MKTGGVLYLVALSFAGLGISFSDCDPRRGSKTMENGNRPSDMKQGQASEFRELSSGKGTTKDGAPFSTQAYESKDGVKILVMRENRDSPERASRRLQERTKEAVEIVEQGSKVDEKGQRVGERVVATFTKNGSSEKEVVILWTNGQQFHYIQSSSLQVAREFEKKFYP